MAKIDLPSKLPARITIDDQPVDLLIVPMTIDEFVEYEHNYFKFGTPDRGIAVAVPGEESMSPVEVLAARAVAAQDRENAMTPDEREAESKRVLSRARELAAWTRESITKWITLPPGQIAVDGVDVTSGEEFVARFGGQTTVLMQVMNILWAVNRLPDDAKKKLKSLSGSQAISLASEMAQRGVRPASIAPRVAGVTSATTAAVTRARRRGLKSCGATTSRGKPSGH